MPQWLGVKQGYKDVLYSPGNMAHIPSNWKWSVTFNIRIKDERNVPPAAPLSALPHTHKHSLTHTHTHTHSLTTLRIPYVWGGHLVLLCPTGWEWITHVTSGPLMSLDFFFFFLMWNRKNDGICLTGLEQNIFF